MSSYHIPLHTRRAPASSLEQKWQKSIQKEWDHSRAGGDKAIPQPYEFISTFKAAYG